MGATTVYLDHAASTPIRADALEAVTSTMSLAHGNPSGAHRLAREARRRIDDARDSLAISLGCLPGEIVFTSGGTEADNLAVFGVHAAVGGTVVVSAVEHHAVLHPAEQLGARVAPVDRMGRLDLDAFAALLDDSVTLVSVMLANNETGVVQPLHEIAAIVAERAPASVLHTDAVQAFPWLDVATLAAPAHLVSIAGHKFGGPMGVGALVVRSGTPLRAQTLGGGQERGLRSGTHNTAGIVGLAVAAASTVAERESTVARVGALRDRLVDGITSVVDDVIETGVDPAVRPADRSGKVAGSCHLCFPGIESESLLFLLEQQGIMASAASSCSSGAQDPSHVLAAMGYERRLAGGSLRLSLGATTTETDVEHAISAVPGAVVHLRSFAS